MNNDRDGDGYLIGRPQEWYDMMRTFHENRPQELCDFSREVFVKMLPPQKREDYPKIIQEIAGVIGLGNAIWLIREWPIIKEEDKRYKNSTVERIRIYIPTKDELKINHRLVKILGWDNAVKMADKFGGRELRPSPKCFDKQQKIHRDNHIKSQVLGGKSIKLVALMNNVSERTVWNLTKNIEPFPPQEEYDYFP